MGVSQSLPSPQYQQRQQQIPNMLTVAGNRGPMVVMTKGLNDANTEKPEWSEEERVVREDVLTNVGDAGGYEDAGLKKQIMVDRSAPVVGGKVSTPGGWVDVSKVTFLPPNPTNKQTRRFKEEKPESGVASSKGPPGLTALFAKGPPGKGKGPGAPMGKGGLGDIFAGGM